jgi:DMSO/TMAO reductase YedYZ molybdopterin-dependent catalytic subunit
VRDRAATHDEEPKMTLADELDRSRSALTMINQSPYNAEAPHAGVAAKITPTDQHYVRSNFALPDHDGVLHVGGAVEHPRTLTLEDLRALPAVQRAVTLECAGNGRLDTRPLPAGEPWGGYAVSTAVWTGARLSDVLAGAVPMSTGTEVRCEGADSGTYHLAPILPDTPSPLTFVRSLTLEHATDPAAEVLVAYEMNGEPLTPDHGAPFRLVVPHWYAVASVKWLKRLDVITEPFAGEFQTGHYMYLQPDHDPEPVARMRVRARLTDPAPGTVLTEGTHTIRGKAWSGNGPVTQVEVSFTGAGEWYAATVEPPAGPHQWQEWSLEWTCALGRYSVRARATDASGDVQPEVPRWNRLGYGNNAVEVAIVDVR